MAYLKWHRASLHSLKSLHCGDNPYDSALTNQCMRKRSLSLTFFSKVFSPAYQKARKLLQDLQQHAWLPQLGSSHPKFQEAGVGHLVLQSIFPETSSNGQHFITEGQEKFTITRLALGDQNFPACEAVWVKHSDWKHVSKRCKRATNPKFWAERFSHSIIFRTPGLNRVQICTRCPVSEETSFLLTRHSSPINTNMNMTI